VRYRCACIPILLALVGCGGDPTPDSSGGAATPSATPVTAAWKPSFVEISSEVGIDFVHVHSGTGEKNFIETMGGGAVLLDHDDDGDLDAYLVQSGALPGSGAEDLPSVLYRNLGDGRFERAVAGVDNLGRYGQGASAADFDNDGLVDLYVTNFGSNRLFHNLGDGTFEDVTVRAGVGDDLWSVSAAWGDFDGDGLLDIYVVNYVDFTMDNNRWCGRRSDDIRAYCHPDQYNGVQPHLYKNRGDGTFADQTEPAGLLETVGKGLGVVASDFDGDGDLDLFGANDSTINYLWRNVGQGRFEDWSLLAGAGYNEDGKEQACMGADAGDFDRDGRMDLFTTNLDLEYNTLYKNADKLSFIDVSFQSGITESHLLYVGFGTEFLDVDLDGWLDVVVVNGHVIDNVADMNDSLTHAQPKSLYRNLDGRRFVEVSDGIAAFNRDRVSRGLAVGDIDGDGDLDLLVGSNNEAAELLRNDGTGAGHFLVVRTEGRASNRQGIGALLRLRVGDATQTEEVRAGTSYGSSSDPRVTFGLGAATRIDELEIRWPSGQVDVHSDLPADRWITVYEGIEATDVSDSRS